MNTAAEYNRQGVEHKQQGRLDEAACCYESALELQPDFAEARYNLGVLWRDRGRIDLALHCLSAAVALRPDVALVHFELANMCMANREFARAVEHYRQALSLSPNWAEAKFNLGNAFLEQRNWTQAEAAFRQVLQITPHDADAWTNLGTALRGQEQTAAAEEAFRRAVRHQPDCAAAWINLGNVLKDTGRLDESMDCYRRAQSVDPQLAAASSNLGNTLLELGQYEAGLTEYLRVAQLRPLDARTHVDLANVLHRLDRTSEAIDAYQRAIHLDSTCTDAWLNLGHLLRGIGDFEQSSAMYRELARRKPLDPLERLRVAANCPLVFSSRDELDRYRREFLDVARELAHAECSLDFSRLTVHAPECPYNLQFLDGNVCPLKEAFADVYVSYFANCRRYPAPHGSQAVRRRIGFVVTARHEMAFLKLLAGVVERLDVRQFEIVILCSRLGAGKIRAGLHRDDVTILEFPERFDHIADCLHRARCDLLYYWEVATDPTNYFLPFLRLAPVQVTSWGIQITSGIPTLDAYLSSALVEHESAANHYTEQLWCASTLLTYQVPVSLPPPKGRAAFGLAESVPVYGCVQNLGKFHPDFDVLLAGILRRDAEGVIVVGQDQHGYAAGTLRRRWQTTMPDVADRIVFFPPLMQRDYLSLLSVCDVLLDPMHFGGVTTTYDALALGKPLITLPTEFHRGRYTAACLRKIGVTETIARDIADYADLAVGLATDRDRRDALSRCLLDAKHQAFEDREAILEHERIFQELLSEVR